MKDDQTKQPKKHPHAEHIVEFARQKANGGLDAGWWNWKYQEGSKQWREAYSPQWLFGNHYRCIKTEKHPQYDKHAEVKAEWEKVKDKGTHEIWMQSGGDKEWHCCGQSALFDSQGLYEIREIKVKSKLKLIPWNKVPKGVATNSGEFVTVNSSGVAKLVSGNLPGFYFNHRQVEYLRLAIEDEQPWIAAEVGSPLAKTTAKSIDFLDIDVKYVDIAYNRAIAVFKVKGIREGWTDNPELCK